MVRIAELIKHPEQLDRDTLYELRSILALYPYYQTARLLMLQNLFLLHDPSFDEELRRAAIYITDRRVLFDMIEAAHYRLRPSKPVASQTAETTVQPSASRTISLIDNFLESMPKEEAPKEKRKPTPADAAVDYVAYLMESEPEGEMMPGEIPQMPGQNLIDSFINSDKGRIVLTEGPLLAPEDEKVEEFVENDPEEEYFTDTLARI